MLTKEDYKNYLDQMRTVEMKMCARYKDLADRLDDQQMKALFSKLSLEEAAHAEIVNTVAKLLLGRMT
ncbi:MAG: hypothetical protein NC938_06020 [Candidatus Omnitrophica bacterium]|nr:hypothetical protein [Candidatus Omnitrophota bacterium]MCM8791233.1 hypothetical protein [Candidatus Omnitrophota bacterium]